MHFRHVRRGRVARVPKDDLLLGECVRAFGRAAATEKGIRISTKLEEPSPVLFADRQLLTQAVNNLLGNSIKYSPDGSDVEVGSACDAAHARIYVRDRGYGIPEEFRARVFEKFYRLERDIKAEVVGTGLGLPLVKEIVERHGGRVSGDIRTRFSYFVSTSWRNSRARGSPVCERRWIAMRRTSGLRCVRASWMSSGTASDAGRWLMAWTAWI